NPLLGMGYDSEKELRAGQCLTGTVTEVGQQTAHIDLTMAISQKELERDLGMGAGFRYRSGMTTTSASAKFAKSSKSTSFSISSIYSGNYIFKDKVFGAPVVNELGQRLLANPERFKKTCGDYYTMVQTFGAKIYFSIRID